MLRVDDDAATGMLWESGVRKLQASWVDGSTHTLVLVLRSEEKPRERRSESDEKPEDDGVFVVGWDRAGSMVAVV